jgi:hypothetical protein
MILEEKKLKQNQQTGTQKMPTIPGEMIISALLNYAASVRSSMKPELLARLDAVLVQQAEDAQRIWRKMWIDAGLIPDDNIKRMAG